MRISTTAPIVDFNSKTIMLSSLFSIILVLLLVGGLLYGAIILLLELASMGPFAFMALVLVVLAGLGYNDYIGVIHLPQHFWLKLGGGAVLLFLAPLIITNIVVPVAKPVIAFHGKVFAVLLRDAKRVSVGGK